MQEDYYASYREYLRKGMRIEIGIPLSGGGIFRDWAVIMESQADDLLVQISRDVLPANVRVDLGFILDVSFRINKEGYSCSGIVAERLGGRVLRIRLFGNFTLQERRQSFRIDLNIRLRYALLSHPNRGDVERDWEHRRDLEHMKSQGYDQFIISTQQARFNPIVPVQWQEILWAEVNLGGGGICIRLPEPVQPERLLNLEIHLPLNPPQQLQAVVEVVHVLAPKVAKDGAVYYPAGMRFVFLDERDRDRIFLHLSVTQIAHLRKTAEMRAFVPSDRPDQPAPVTWREVVPRVVWALFFLVVTLYLVKYFIHYRETGPSNPIQKIYEKSIRQHRHLDQ